MQVDIGSTKIKLIDGCRICSHQVNGGFEKQTGELWSQIVGKGMTVIDVGAYTGPYTIAGASQGARVFAYEPNISTYARLKANIAMNNLGSDTAVPFMVGALDENHPTLPFFKSQRNPLTSAASFIPSDALDCASSARAVTLDGDMIYFGNRVNAMKIDVEGTEARVLKGAQKLLKRDRPELIIELLTSEAVQQILPLLPNYKLVRVLDGRNYFYTAAI